MYVSHLRRLAGSHTREADGKGARLSTELNDIIIIARKTARDSKRSRPDSVPDVNINFMSVTSSNIASLKRKKKKKEEE